MIDESMKIYEDVPDLVITTLRDLKTCITPNTVFKSPVAPTFIAKEPDRDEDLGVVLLPRKYLTEELNGVKTDLRLMESRVVFDCRVKKRPMTLEADTHDRVIGFDAPFKSLKKPYTLPKTGDRLRLFANGMAKIDKRTPTNIKAIVTDVRPGSIKIRMDGGYSIRRSRKYAVVTMDLELDGQNFKQSIMADHFNPIYYNEKIKLI
jgi:hypothetical protein